jgi:hypothetical protein
MRLAVALTVCGVAASLTAATARSAPPACQTAETRTHDEAVFGHFASPAAAAATMRHARKAAFKGLKLEQEGCGDYELEIDGADSMPGRTSFAGEAKRAGFQVTFEQTAPPLEYRPGEVVGTFGRFRSVGAANALSQRLAAASFRYTEIAFAGGRWLVLLPQVPVKSALSIAAEAHRAGFHVTFREGTRASGTRR